MRYSDYAVTTPSTLGNDLVTVRVDKGFPKVMDEFPAGRWDPEYWLPQYEITLNKISKKWDSKPLAKILRTPIIAPDHVRASKGESIGAKHKSEYRTLKDLLITGLNYAAINYCSENAFKRLKRTQLQNNDILYAG